MEESRAMKTERDILVREVTRLIQDATTHQIRVIYRFVLRYLSTR